jgi:hypothetical protein
VHGDDTTVPVLAPGKTVTGRLWTYVRDDRPFAGPDPPAAVFFYSRNRAGEHPARHLADYAGILQADAYAGFGDLYDGKRKPGPITEAACWSHGRRHFFEQADLRKAPLAIEAVRRIDEIFAIERRINGQSAADRLAVRQSESKPVLVDLETWMLAERARLSRHAATAQAIDYMLTRWPAFTRFLDDGRICLSNNAAERALRSIALGRRSWLFAGSDEGASCCSPHHAIDKPSRFCWRWSGSGRRDRRILACRRTSSRTRSSCRIIHGAPLQCCLAGRMPSAMRRRMVEVLTARPPAASSIVTSPRSARSPSR